MTTPSPDHITRPDFGISVRGYDRVQVDAYFGRVIEWLAEAENRAMLAERVRESLAREVTDLRTSMTMLEQHSGLPAPESMSAFSERMGQVMESAVLAAQELRAEAAREAQDCRESAEREAERTIAAARDESEGVVDAARRAQRAMEESIGDLQAARAEAVESLLDLQRRIAAVVGVPAPSASVDGTIGDEDGDVGDDAEDRVDEATVVDDVDSAGDVAGLVAPSDNRIDDSATDHGVLVTATPTIVQPAVGRGAAGNGAAKGRRRSA